jgi:hypothetical protein
MGHVSDAARVLDMPQGPFDKLQFAYKVSKTALNQGACRPGSIYRAHTPWC